MRRVLAAVAALAFVPGASFAQEEEPEVVESEPELAESASPESVGQTAAPGAPTGEAGSPDTYTVQPGDTLWEISQRFLGNPWYWPKVWSFNPEIENPHWIYPGNLVRFYPTADDLPTQLEGEEPTPDELGEVTLGSLHAPNLFNQEEDVVEISQGMKLVQSTARKDVIRQDGLVTSRELEEAGVIDRAWAEKEMLSASDRVYLRFRGVGALRVGDLYSVFRTVGEVKHPVTRLKFGYLTRVVGVVRLVGVEKNGTVVGVIDQSIEEIHRGFFVGPLGNFDKQVIAKPSARQIDGVILCSAEPSLPFMGESHLLFIDKGTKDGVEEGNLFTVVRQGDPLRSKDPEEVKRLPLEDVATILVIDAKETASAGMVVRSLREVVAGDRVIARSAVRAVAR